MIGINITRKEYLHFVGMYLFLIFTKLHLLLQISYLNVHLTPEAEHYILLSPRKFSQASRRALGPTGKKPLLRRRRFDKTVIGRKNQIESQC